MDLRRMHSSIYALRWEIERTFPILEEIMGSENIWYNKNRDYDAVIRLKILEYNLIAESNINMGENPREITKIVKC